MTTGADRIADSFISATKSLEDLPSRRAEKRRREEEERRRREAGPLPIPTARPASIPMAHPAPIQPSPFADSFLPPQPGLVPTPVAPGLPFVPPGPAPETPEQAGKIGFLEGALALALDQLEKKGQRDLQVADINPFGAAGGPLASLAGPLATGLAGPVPSLLETAEQVSQPFEVATDFVRPGFAVNPAFSSLAETTPVEVNPEGNFFTQAVERERGQNLVSQILAGALTDPTIAFPLEQGIQGLQRAARPAIRRGVEATGPAIRSVGERVRPVFADERGFVRFGDETAGAGEDIPLPGNVPDEVPVEEALAPRTSVQGGFDIGEPAQQVSLDVGGRGAPLEPLIPSEQIIAQERRVAEVAAGQQALPEDVPLALQPFDPVEAAELELDQAIARLEGELQAKGRRQSPAFGSAERRDFDSDAAVARNRVIEGGQEPARRIPRNERVRLARASVRAARTKLKEVSEAGGGAPPEPPIIPPVGSAAPEPEPGETAGYIEWFRRFLSDPKRIEDWDVTIQQRREVLARRGSGVESAVNQLIAEGHSSEDAIRMARASLSGELPTPTTGIQQVVTPAIRQALFDEVRLVLADEPFEMISTHQALTNALLGRAIPRTPGTAGGSAFSRLSRVFGDEIAEALAQRQTLDEVITFQARGSQTTSGGRVRAPGEFRTDIDPRRPEDFPGTQVFGGENPTRLIPEAGALEQPQVPLVPQPPPGPFDPRVPNTRTIGEQEVDLQTFRETIGEAQAPTTPGVQNLTPDELVLRTPQESLLPETPPGPFAERIRTYLSPGQRVKRAEDFKRMIDRVTALPEPIYDRMIRWAKTLGLTAQDFGNLLRANMASTDLSYTRQQAFLIFGNPVKFAKSFPEALRAMWSNDYAKGVEAGIKNDPLYSYYTRGIEERKGADFLRTLDSPEAKAWDVEEQFQVLAGTRPLQRLANKLPWLNISNRAFITGVNHMNWSIYRGHMQTLLRNNEQVAAGNIRNMIGGKRTHLSETDIRKSMNVASKMLADMSARGPLGPLKEMSPALNAAFFSLRSTIGRLISPRHMISRDPFVRSAAWKNFLTAIGGFSSFIFAGQQMGLWDVETDPRSSDFMKIKLAGGKLTIDIWGGHQQYAVLYARLLPLVGGIKSVQTGKVSDYDPVTGITRFNRNKASPLISKALTLWTGKDFRGQEIDRRDWKRWLKESAQLSVQDVMEAYGAMGLLGLFAGIPSGVFGFGVTGRPLTRNDKSLEMFGIPYDDLPLANRRERIPDRRKLVREALALDLSEEEKAKTQEKKDKQQDRRDERELERRGNFLQGVPDSREIPERPAGVSEPPLGSQTNPIPAGPGAPTRRPVPGAGRPVSGVGTTPNEMTPAERTALMEFYRESGSSLKFEDWVESVRR